MVALSDAAPAEAPQAEPPTAADAAAEPLLAEEPVSMDLGSELVGSAHAPPAASLPAMPEPPSDPVLAWGAGSSSVEADEAVPLDLEELDTPIEVESPRPEGIQLEQPVTLEAPVQPLAGLVGRHDRADDADVLTTLSLGARQRAWIVRRRLDGTPQLLLYHITVDAAGDPSTIFVRDASDLLCLVHGDGPPKA